MNAVQKELYGIDNLTATPGSLLYTVPALTVSTATFISVANKTASPVTVTLMIGTSTFLPSVSVAGNTVATFDLKRVLATGQTITGSASAANAIAISINGTEVS